MFGKKGLKPNSIQTLIGESARIEGNLLFDGGCHVDGDSVDQLASKCASEVLKERNGSGGRVNKIPHKVCPAIFYGLRIADSVGYYFFTDNISEFVHCGDVG